MDLDSKSIILKVKNKQANPLNFKHPFSIEILTAILQT